MNDILVLEEIIHLYVKERCLQIRVGKLDYEVTCLSRHGHEQQFSNSMLLYGRYDQLEGKLVLGVEERYVPAATEDEEHKYEIILNFQDGTQKTFSWKLEHDWRKHKGSLRIVGKYYKY